MFRLISILNIIAILSITGCSQSEYDAKVEKGMKIVKQNCKVCHAQGLNGAPILGNTKMWAKRAPQGQEVLVQHAMQGYGLMPAKGGNEALTEAEIDAAVTYMLSLLNQ